VKFPWQRSTTPETSGSDALGAPADPQHPAGKGRPTPTRKEAEAARKQSLRVPSDPKEAKKAARARAAEQRSVEREALMRGDERALPARDAGPVKKYVRNFIDGRFTLGELFLPVALAVLVLGFVPNSSVKFAVTLAWMVLTVLIIVDTTLLMMRLNRQLKAQWPDPADRKGTSLYAVMRVLQFRRLRLPPPAITRRGQPIVR
jgi:Protein of unknown function (DUF3043)